MGQLIDSNPTSGYDSTKATLTVSGWYAAAGVAINLPVGKIISNIKFYGIKVNSPTGNVYAKIYNSTGTVGSTAKPTGAALATSDAVVASTFPGTIGLVDFTFTNRIYVPAGDICIACYYNGGDGSNYVEIGQSAAAAHAGNKYTTPDAVTWSADATKDIIFELYGESRQRLISVI